MRTLLTYVLAALSAAAFPAVWGAFEAAVYLQFEGDGSVLSGAAVYAAIQLIVWAVALLVLGVPLWIGVQKIFAVFGRSTAGAAGVLSAVSAFGVLFLAMWLALFQTDWFAFQRAGEQSVVWDLAAMLGLLTMPGILVILGGAVIGAAWGTVFWIRAPKPTTAGIAA
ncbi:hypothetical protein [Maricaulis parjimensis]|uniref:hypothetical protein n=1 Tax=Maricaulis parjimensis TaxID=144023 RepID=UPI001939A945|nr:hypothetical protein [Maricaulis parjimensis]